jgi:hypothetical protein
MVRPLVRAWPLLAVGLVVAHAALHIYLQSRPGASAMFLFVAGPRVLFTLTVLTIVAAVYDLLYGGWRRLLRGALIFPIASLAGSVFLSLITYRAYPSSHDNRPAAWCLTLPLAGDIAVLHGGRTVEENAHAGSPSQRYAYDLGVARVGSTPAGGLADAADDAYGQPVSAPVAGVVVAVTDGLADRTSSTVVWPESVTTLGNHVVLRVDEGQFLFLGRLQPGTIQVRPGDRVERGEPLGHVGRPDAAVPHLHIHLQDREEPNLGEAIPVDVCSYEAIDAGDTWDATRPFDRGMPTGRDRRQVIRSR